jgi:hypothetical protein
VKGELQNAADSAALAAAQALPDGPGQVRLAAQNVAASNSAANNAVALQVGQSQDVELGDWDDETRIFTPLSGSSENEATAVRVNCHLRADRGTQLNLFFAPVIGTDSMNLRAVAVACLDVVKCGRFVGLDSAVVTSGYVDSYDSSKGTYQSQNPGDQGNVCSNGDISIQNATVNGNASPGEGYAVNVSGQGSVSGSTDPHKKLLEGPPVDPGNASSYNDNDLIDPMWFDDFGNLKIPANKSLTLPGGVYFFSKDFTVNGTLTFTSPATIYIQGKVSISGQGLINESQMPGNLLVYPLSDTNVTLSMNNSFYGVVYAPLAQLTVTGNADYYGAALAKSLKLVTSGGVHYDEALEPIIDEQSRPVLKQ